MVWTGVLKAVLLLSFLTSSIGIDEPGPAPEPGPEPGTELVNNKALTHIIKVIHEHASEVFSGTGSTSNDSPDIHQYAVAVRITKNVCVTPGLTSPIEADLQSNEFKNAIKNKDVFITKHVIAAKYKNMKHSEYRLLIEKVQNAKDRFIDRLLKKGEGRNENDCVIFYTYNSPCLKTCLNETEYSEQKARDDTRVAKGRNASETYRYIIPFLEILKNHKGPKAFVFKQVYREDIGNIMLKEQFEKLNNEIHLYQCNDDCKLCKDDTHFCAPP